MKPEKLTKSQFLFILTAACCIISFFALAFVLSEPKINVNGSEHVYIDRGERYIERGAKATDADGKTIPVTVFGTVDSEQLGEVEIVYTASNRGRTVSTVRKVTVMDGAK